VLYQHLGNSRLARKPHMAVSSKSSSSSGSSSKAVLKLRVRPGKTGAVVQGLQMAAAQQRLAVATQVAGRAAVHSALR
jgi:hypothetical protein